MHSVEELGPNVSAFLAKLWKIVEDPATNDLICWNSSGTSFYIRDQARFARELLPLYYKHNNMPSFVRQLNMYGFHKVVSIEGGGLRPDKDEMEFAHQCFLMDHPYLITHIKRKIPVQRIDENVQGSQPEIIKKVLTDVKGLKGRQETLNSQLNEMKRENEVLWRELAVLRQKHIKQQQIVNKLIQFLVSMVHNTHTRNTGIGIKRFMLSHLPHNDTPSKHTKSRVHTSSVSDVSSGGPVIHEIDAADLLEECAAAPEEEEELPTNQEDYLSSDFCSEPGTAENIASPHSSAGSMSSLEAAVNTASPEMLLELAEECSLQSDLLSSQVKKFQHSTKQKRRKSQSKGGNRRKRLKKIESENVENADESSFQQLAQSDQEQVILPTCTSETIEISSETVPEKTATPVDTDIAKAWTALTTYVPIGTESVAANKIVKVEAKEEKKIKSEKVIKEEKNIKEEVNGSGPSTSAIVASVSRSSSPSLSLSRSGSSELCRLPEELDLHLDSMDSELDSIKELLKGEGYSLDANTLLGLFSDDPLAYELPMPVDPEAGSKVVGSELMAYTPNAPNLDFTDLFGSAGGEEWRESLPLQAEENTQDVTYSAVNTPMLRSDDIEDDSQSSGVILGS